MQELLYVQFTRVPEYPQRWHLNCFVKDNWKLGEELTLVLGVRYEYDSPTVDKNNIVASFNSANSAIAVPGCRFAQQNIKSAFPSRFRWRRRRRRVFQGARSATHSGWQRIRVGFAWRPFNNENTVVRGGYGSFFDGAMTP